MPTPRRSGLAIHYELEGSGPALVLLHGEFASSETWRMEGYVEALRDDHLLVLVDARGRGRSDKPHEPAAYANSCMASDVLAVLDEVGLASAALRGFSMGAITALRVAACHPDRVDVVAAVNCDPEAVGFADLPAGEADYRPRGTDGNANDESVALRARPAGSRREHPSGPRSTLLNGQPTVGSSFMY
jgi:pimeloyl-ACP methyl ester carboxylesterase